MNIVLTKVTIPVIGWIGSVLGWIINGIYSLLEMIGISNIGLAIILFCLVVYILMTPMQIKQQKFTKLNSVMQPEIQKIQNKYKNKKDQESLNRQNQEISAIYQKYGVSPIGSCGQLLIQMPVLIALYQVIYHIPGYISGVRNVFEGLATKVMSVSNYGEVIGNFLRDNRISLIGVSANKEFDLNHTIDFLYKLSPSQMDKFAKLPEFSGMQDAIEQVASKASHINSFFNLNISDTPMQIIQSGWTAKTVAGYLLVFSAVLIPFLAWFTQMLNVKLMPQPDSKGEPSAMETSMKGMNTFMPLMSAFFCLSLPVGIGIYWIIGAVIRVVQMVVINKKMDRMDVQEMIDQNQEKMKKKMEKRGISPQRINEQARMNVRNVEQKKEKPVMSAEEREEKVKKSTEYYNSNNAKPGSLASKANMVKQFNEKNSKK